MVLGLANVMGSSRHLLSYL